MGAWSTTKIPMMLFDVTQLGVKFAIARFALNLVGIASIILAFIMEKTTTVQERNAVCEAASCKTGIAIRRRTLPLYIKAAVVKITTQEEMDRHGATTE